MNMQVLYLFIQDEDDSESQKCVVVDSCTCIISLIISRTLHPTGHAVLIQRSWCFVNLEAFVNSCSKVCM